MTRKYYKWNVENIFNLVRKIESEVNALRRDSANLDRLKQDIQSSWQSISGMEYVGNLDINKKEIQRLIKETEKMQNELEDAANAYAEAEDEIRQILGLMIGRIQH